MIRTRLGVLVLAAGVAVLGCSSAEEPATPATATTTSAEEPAAPATDALVIDVRIAGSSVTPANDRLEAKVGQELVLRVDSDVTEELHVHATPEHTFAVAPTTGQEFRFTVEVPGRVEIELHGSHRTVATILVRP
ncbi:hypothetical protein ACFVVM_14125 [Nocardia sp. NPDC058176]|uniref:hypothetical protein n=1 Tax=Nocardia sp. NPDC058176 TaxID=3346368 RepID=UPI0036D7650C